MRWVLRSERFLPRHADRSRCHFASSADRFCNQFRKHFGTFLVALAAREREIAFDHVLHIGRSDLRSSISGDSGTIASCSFIRVSVSADRGLHRITCRFAVNLTVNPFTHAVEGGCGEPDL